MGMSGVWVFGYGSLVSPASFGQTIGRALQPGVDFFEAEVTGYGRRWNYGVMHSTGYGTRSADDAIEYTLVALGVVPSPDESVNGVVGWVAEDELVVLDRRERHYDRVDASSATTIIGANGVEGPVMIYVPRAEAIAHYEQARDRGVAAIEQRYWELVDNAFEAFGTEAHARYRSTPAPDVPVLSLTRT